MQFAVLREVNSQCYLYRKNECCTQYRGAYNAGGLQREVDVPEVRPPLSGVHGENVRMFRYVDCISLSIFLFLWRGFFFLSFVLMFLSFETGFTT